MKRMLRVALPVLVLLAFAASLSAQETNMEAESAALRKADVAWAKVATQGNVEGFVSMVDENGSILSPHAPSLNGKEAIKEWVTAVMSNPGFALSWKPTEVHVAAGGDIGFTVGTYEMTLHDPEGNPMHDSGKYMTVWKKQSDGSWKVFRDMFNTNLPPQM